MELLRILYLKFTYSGPLTLGDRHCQLQEGCESTSSPSVLLLTPKMSSPVQPERSTRPLWDMEHLEAKHTFLWARWLPGRTWSWLMCCLIIETFLDHLKFNSTTTPGGYRVQIMKAFLQELGDVLRRLSFKPWFEQHFFEVGTQDPRSHSQHLYFLGTHVSIERNEDGAFRKMAGGENQSCFLFECRSPGCCAPWDERIPLPKYVGQFPGSGLGPGRWPWAQPHPTSLLRIAGADPQWFPAIRAGSPLVPKAFPALGSATPQRPCNGFLVGVAWLHSHGQTLSSRRRWRHELSVPPAQSDHPATPSPPPCASWPIVDIVKVRPGPLAPYRQPARCSLPLGSLLLTASTEAGEAPATTAALSSHEPGLWLNGTPPGSISSQERGPHPGGMAFCSFFPRAARMNSNKRQRIAAEATGGAGGGTRVAGVADWASRTLSSRRQRWRASSASAPWLCCGTEGASGQQAHVPLRTIKSGELGACLLWHQAFQKPPPSRKLLKGLVHQRTGTQLPRDRKRKRVYWTPDASIMPKLDPEIKIVYLRCTDGEVGATSALTPQICPLGLSPKKVADDIAKATADGGVSGLQPHCACHCCHSIGLLLLHSAVVSGLGGQPHKTAQVEEGKRSQGTLLREEALQAALPHPNPIHRLPARVVVTGWKAGFRVNLRQPCLHLQPALELPLAPIAGARHRSQSLSTISRCEQQLPALITPEGFSTSSCS
ncbi:hypothetical protein QTO34_004428 [Cnephaeus nilssonii]|uniref:Large ribosomal subunit protein uL11 N-terminal domain-containing protein n=1 Tax=Cnephaeus nilssonii TaxID=3371016 RepID=A0AA40HQ80_CNENI|nr:hypothetical protein QTO34_004428 [Eptesicus nilssonii]